MATAPPARAKVLALYRQTLRVARSWPDAGEKEYIRTEARRLLARNAALLDDVAIGEKIREFESRLSIGVHYGNPYPRFANVVPGATGERPTAAHPVYLDSYRADAAAAARMNPHPRPRAGVQRPPGAASLHEQLDKLIVVCLRDGRVFRGVLRSYDQYANLVLDGAVERVVRDAVYADARVGVMVVRGENVMLLGEVDAAADAAALGARAKVPQGDVRKPQHGASKELQQWPIPEF